MNKINDLIKSWQKENRALKKQIISAWNGGACTRTVLHEVDRLNAKYEILH